MDDFNGYVGRHIDGFDRGYSVGHWKLEGRMLLEFCLEKELCVSNIWFKRAENSEVTFRIVKKTKFDFVLIKKEHRLFIQYVKAIPG